LTPNQSIVLQGYCAVVIAFGTLAIPLLIWISGRRMAAVQYVRDLQDLINQVSALALQSDDNLAIVTRVIGLEGYAHNVEEMRKVYLTFVCMNAFQAEFLGMKAGLVQARYAHSALQQLVDPMLGDELVWRLVRERGYHPDFVDFCAQIRHRRSSRAVSEPQSPAAKPASPAPPPAPPADRG
jgi:hypothetical protein